MMQPARSKRLFNYTLERNGLISLSRFPEPRKGKLPSRKPSFEGVPSETLRSYSQPDTILRQRKRTCGGSARIAAGLDPNVHSVASMFISRWDKAVMGKVPKELQDLLGIAIAKRTYKAYRELLRRGGENLPVPALHRSPAWQAPAPKTPRPPTSFTSRRSLHRTPSIRFLRRRCLRSATTARLVRSCPRTAAMPRV